MGALNPVFFAAALAVAVPLFLHLFQRQETRRLAFPALRYLERTEREHAKRIRFRQLLLLLLRLAVLLLLVGAGARLFVRGRGSAHPPTAVVIVLDNSMSTGLVVGERRVFDQLVELADRTLAAAGAEDRFWVLPTGAARRAAVPGGAAQARRSVAEIEVQAGRGDLTGALVQASELLASSTLPHKEIHLLSDLQATGFNGGASEALGGIPVVVWRPEPAEVPNHALSDVVVGGGLPPLQGQRSEAAITAMAVAGDTTLLPVRLVVDGRIRGAATLPPGAATVVPLPPAGAGWVRGYAESDPDPLRADDRRYFAFRSRPPTRVALAGDAGVFVDQALSVLDSAGRLVRTPAGRAELLIAVEAHGLDALGAAGSAVVVPPADPALLPAVNRRLADAGVPWRYEQREGVGEAVLDGPGLPEPLEGVRLAGWYRLTLGGDPPAPSRTIAEVRGEPWALEGVDARGHPYLLLASPLDVGSTSLPVSAGMLQFVDWVASRWAGSGSGGRAYLAGETLPAPRGATHVRLPSGEVVEIDGTRSVTRTAEAGFYEFLAADTVVSIHALNPPPEESDLTPLDHGALEAELGEVVEVSRAERWPGAVYRARQGPELWWPLLGLALALLLVEAAVAASGGPVSRRGEASIRSREAPADAA